MYNLPANAGRPRLTSITSGTYSRRDSPEGTNQAPGRGISPDTCACRCRFYTTHPIILDADLIDILNCKPRCVFSSSRTQLSRSMRSLPNLQISLIFYTPSKFHQPNEFCLKRFEFDHQDTRKSLLAKYIIGSKTTGVMLVYVYNPIQ
jgi:hypothetical protein